MSLDRVPGAYDLYIGGPFRFDKLPRIFSLRRHEALKAANITHVLSVLRAPLDNELVRNFRHLMIEVDDVDYEYIIEHFRASNEFIAEGLKGGGGVLVHCAMGKSRSATLVIAYLLSIHPEPTSSSVQECLNLVRQTHPIAEPNSGFENQLNLYARMGCPDDIHTNPEYQRWLYKQEATNSLSTRQAPSNVYFADKAEKSITPDYESEYETEWKCKKCRRSLARKEFEEKHVPKAQSPDERSSTRKPKVPSLNHRHESSDRHSKPLTSSVAMFEDSLGSPEARESCAHIFLYPLLWMKEELEAEKLEGRLECPNSKCRANVGKYAWQGLQCSCGKWVVPAIALARGRVDEMKVRRNLGVGVSKKGQEAMEQEVGGLKI